MKLSWQVWERYLRPFRRYYTQSINVIYPHRGRVWRILSYRQHQNHCSPQSRTTFVHIQVQTNSMALKSWQAIDVLFKRSTVGNTHPRDIDPISTAKDLLEFPRNPPVPLYQFKLPQLSPREKLKDSSDWLKYLTKARYAFQDLSILQNFTLTQ